MTVVNWLLKLLNQAGDVVNPATLEQQAEILRAMVSARDGTGHSLVSTRHNHWEARFFEHAPANILNLTLVGAATTGQHEGHAHFDTGAAAGSSFLAEMREPARYASQFANFYAFTAALPVVTGDGRIDIGPGANPARADGYILRRTSAGVAFVHKRNSVEDAPILSGAWNGKAATQFTRGAVVEAIDFTKTNVYFVTQLWLGSGPVTLWIYTPDANEGAGAAIPLHTFRHPNTDTEPSTTTPNLRLAAYGTNGGVAENLSLRSGCWAVGNTAPERIPVISEANSTAVAADFTGQFVSTIHYPNASARVTSNTSGTLFVDYSDDGAAVAYTESFAYDSADGVVIFQIDARAEFMRLRYVATVAPATLSIATTLSASRPAMPTRKVQSTMGKGVDALPTSAQVFVLDGQVGRPLKGDQTYGAFVDVKRSALPAGAASEATLAGRASEVTLGSRASEATLASVLAKLDISVSALRDALRGSGGKNFTDIWNSLQTQREIATSLWTDDSGAKYVRRDTIDESTGTVTVTFTNETGGAATPGAGLRPLATSGKETLEALFTVITAGTGYAINDILARVLVVDTSVTPPTAASTWMNVTAGTIIAAPNAAHLDAYVGLTDQELALRLGASTDAEAAGDGTLIAIQKRLRTLAGRTQYAEDAAHVGGDFGQFMLGVRSDAMAALTSTNGDYSPLAVDDRGRIITQDKIGQWFAQGKLRICGVSLQSGVATAQTFRFLNNSGTGKVLLILRAWFTATQAATFQLYKGISALGAPTAATPWNPNFAFADTTDAQVTYQSAAPAGGAILAAPIRVASDITIPFDLPILLAPTQNVAANTTIALGQTGFVAVLYVEDR